MNHPMTALLGDPAVMYAGVAAMGIGVIGLILALASPKKATDSLDVEARINAFSTRAPAKVKATSLKEAAQLKAAEALANNKTVEARIAARLDGAGASMKPAEWVLLHGACSVGTGTLLFLVSGLNIVLFPIGLVVGAVLPWVFLGMKRSRRIKAFGTALPETLQLMSGSLSAGLSLAQSVDTIVREGGEPIASEFRRVVVESRLGVPLEDAMEGVAERMESKDFSWVVMAIRIQREVGGNLAELLLTVAGTLREREYIRRHVKALSAEGRLSMYVLGGLPPVFLLYLSLTKWDYVSVLFTSKIGIFMLIGMAILLFVGCFWMAKVSKVEL